MKITLRDLKTLIHHVLKEEMTQKKEIEENSVEQDEITQGHEDPSPLAQMNREGDGISYDVFGNPK